MPTPATVTVGSLGDLGSDLGNREWLMVQSRYHRLHFQPSDAATAAALYPLIDNLRKFLDGRSPARPGSAVLVFLVPGESGNSRCSFQSNSMRTGAMGDLSSLLTSLLHEETHLFNNAFLAGKAQGWWTGEYACLYFQRRALLLSQGSNIKAYCHSRLPNGPSGRLAELDGLRRDAFDEAFAAQYFLEETYGRPLLNSFRLQCLVFSRASNGGRPAKSVFEQVFGKNIEELDREWRAFFAWGER